MIPGVGGVERLAHPGARHLEQPAPQRLAEGRSVDFLIPSPPYVASAS